MGNIDALTIWVFLVIAGMVLTMIMPNLFAEPRPVRRRQLQVQAAKWISSDRGHASPRAPRTYFLLAENCSKVAAVHTQGGKSYDSILTNGQFQEHER